MKKFVVGYLTFFDNELELYTVEAKSDVDACLQVLKTKQWETDITDMETLKQQVFDWDSAINAIEV